MSSSKSAFLAEFDRRMAECRRRLEQRNAEIGAEIAARRAHATNQHAPIGAPSQDAATDIEAQARREYELSTALPGEFGSVECYVAYRRAEAAGRIKIFGVPRR